MDKIAYLVGAFPQWSESFIEQELRLLLAANLPLFPIAIRPGPAPLPTDLATPPAFLCPEPPAPETRPTKPRGGLLPDGAWRRRASLIKHRRQLAALRRLLEFERAAHIHAAFGDLVGLLAAAAAKALGIGYSVSIHASDALVAKYDDAFLFDEADFVSVCNQRLHDLFVSRCPAAAPRTHLIRHGVVLSDWPLRIPSFKPHDPLRFLFVGRLVGKKRPDMAVAAVNCLRQSGRPARLRLIGDGPLEATLGDDAGVDRLGVVGRKEIGNYMAESDFLLVSSTELESGDMEGIPNVVVEAMATGLPVIASPTGGIPEVVSPATGYLYDPLEPDAFPALMQSILAHPEEVSAKAAAARALVERDFDATKLIQAKIALLRDSPSV